MGIVCLGRHTHLDQRVAIKFLKRSLSGRPVIVQRFLNEARALASLRSEHVVRVMDVGQLESGRPYLVMEHLDGIDLDGLLVRDGPLAVETAVEYAVQVCEAMSEAHALGIVHRDLKPENLFLWSGGPGKDVVKVLDFGLAKGLVSAVSATGPQDSMGSPCYMSPEQIVTPHLTDSRTDVWSLGVVLYRLLTDTLPFDGNDVTAVFGHVLHAAPPSLRDVLPGADQELDDIVQQCLEKSPADRYATMSALSDALVAYLAHRRSGSPAPATMPPAARPTLEIIDDTKIRIPGVHVRWPWILAVLLAAAAAGVYQADRSGRIRALDYTDGWLTPLAR
jgi:serine/threonine-protein kinase